MKEACLQELIALLLNSLIVMICPFNVM